MPKVKSTRHKLAWESKSHNVWIGIGSDIYLFHLELWRFGMTINAKGRGRS